VNLGYPKISENVGNGPDHLLRWQAIRRTLGDVSEKPPPVRRGRLSLWSYISQWDHAGRIPLLASGSRHRFCHIAAQEEARPGIRQSAAPQNSGSAVDTAIGSREIVKELI
jgi:hypothetical protein